MPASPCNISAEADLRDVNIKVLDYRWDPNERISDCQDVFVLRYRPEPTQIGVAAHLLDGRVQHFGQLMFFPALTRVQTTPAKVAERTRIVMCSFTQHWFQQIWPDRQGWSTDDLAQCYDMRNFRIEQAMIRLGLETTNPGFASEFMLESLARMIAVELARHFKLRERPRHIRTSEGRLTNHELSRIYELIDLTTNKSPTAEELSRSCGISSAHLRRIFKRTTGITLHQYIADIRHRKAQSLLAETDLPLKELAFRLGFSSSCTFSSTFRKAGGETPGDYRLRFQHMSSTLAVSEVLRLD